MSRQTVSSLTQLPRSVDQWMVEWQLKNYPDVEKLWR